MAWVYFMEDKRTAIEVKWEKCRPFYEKYYRIKFRRTPSPKEIEFLYSSMNLLKEALLEHGREARKYLQGLAASSGHSEKPRF